MDAPVSGLPSNKAMTAAIIVIGLCGVAIADELERWCPTMIAIYGMCSPELVENWLAYQSNTPLDTPPAQLPEPPLDLDSTDAGATPGAQNAVEWLPACWYMLGGERKCQNGSHYYIVENESLTPPPYGCGYKTNGVLWCQEPAPEPEVWYKDKMWMVS